MFMSSQGSGHPRQEARLLLVAVEVDRQHCCRVELGEESARQNVVLQQKSKNLLNTVT